MHVKVKCRHCGRSYKRYAYDDATATESEKKLWTDMENNHYGACPQCHEEYVTPYYQDVNEAAAKEAEERKLCELEGTVKQVKWANTIRIEVLKQLDTWMTEEPKRLKAYTDEFGESAEATEIYNKNVQLTEATITYVKNITEAKTFIDNRERNYIAWAGIVKGLMES